MDDWMNESYIVVWWGGANIDIADMVMGATTAIIIFGL